MATKYLIDTSAVVKYLNNSFSHKALTFMDGVVDKECLLSFITAIELQVWNPPNPEDMTVYTDFINRSSIYYIEDSIIQETINIRKQYGLKIPDALIAATAMVYQLTLIADNDKDFLKVKNLKYINPNNL